MEVSGVGIYFFVLGFDFKWVFLLLVYGFGSRVFEVFVAFLWCLYVVVLCLCGGYLFRRF